MVLALPPHLVQQQVPAVNRGQQVLVLPKRDLEDTRYKMTLVTERFSLDSCSFI
jgi:hypothetical protein